LARCATGDTTSTFFGGWQLENRKRVKPLARVTSVSAVWEQSFSFDDGATWDANWTTATLEPPEPIRRGDT
jgi:hypothetical protein